MDIFLKSTVALWLSAAVLIGGQKAEFQREWNRAYEARLYSQMLENCQHNPTIFEMEDQNESEASEESAQESQSVETVGQPSIPYYQVNGCVMDLALQDYLYSQLSAKGIGWFMPYAMMLAYQESNFNIYAENPNRLDKGLFQYRITYWGAGDIFNPYTQIDIFTTQMSNRANIGCTVSDMISRHNMSDYGPYNQDYVNHVMSWEGTLIRIN